MRRTLLLAWTITKKDLRTEMRSASAIITMVLLGFLVVLVFSFSMDSGAAESDLARSGVLWAAFLFPGLLAVGRPFEGEKEAQCLEGLLLCPIDRGVVYLGKLLSSLVLSSATGLLVLIFFGVLFDVGLSLAWLALLGVMVLAAVGLSAIGTLAAALTAGDTAQGASHGAGAAAAGAAADSRLQMFCGAAWGRSLEWDRVLAHGSWSYRCALHSSGFRPIRLCCRGMKRWIGRGDGHGQDRG